MPTHTPWMIYGANGYTGEKIAREAVARGLRPTLAGRTLAKIAPLAHELGLPSLAFDLSDPAVLATHLQGMKLVLLTAGPFSATSAKVVEACLASGANYLDITGEIDVFEHAFAQSARAKSAGVALCPGVGFDVIPTDCVAATLKAALPDATALSLAFHTASGISPGTLKTMVETVAQGGKVRRDGVLVPEPNAAVVRKIDFGEGGRHMGMSAPWGDVSTAFHSTGIPNVRAYLPASGGQVLGAKVMGWLSPLLRRPSIQAWLFRQVERRVKGPSEHQMARTPTHVWGEVTNDAGERRTARVVTDNGYSLTVTGSLAVVQHLLANEVTGGTYTPSMLMGADFVSRLPRCGPIAVTP